MALFSTDDRKNLLDYITAFAQRNEHIMALVAVGSGAYGYIDELSDLDFVVAIDDSGNLDAVRDYVANQLKKRAPFIYFKQAPNIPLQVFMLDNYLEIDVGYGVYTSAAANRAHWKVLFDKTGTVDAAMRRSWETRTAAPVNDEYAKKQAECADHAWHNLMHCAVAIKRGQYWRAVSELDIARNLLVNLLGAKYSIEVERGRDLDKLPECELNALKKTLTTELSRDSLWESLNSLVKRIYAELDTDIAAVGKSQVREYIDACRNMSDGTTGQ